MSTDPFTTPINVIKLCGVIPQSFDNEAGRALFAQSDVMLAPEVVLERGRIYCINASSGTGKTSLCSFIYGSRRDYTGDIYFDSVAARSLSAVRWCDLRRRHLAYLPQELDIFNELSVIDNIRLKNNLTGHCSEERIRAMLSRLEIDSLADRQAAYISVGQRQRVALVRTLCQPFDFLLLDEPVSHLDTRTNALCAALVAECAAEQGATVIFTSVGNRLDIDSPVTDLQL